LISYVTLSKSSTPRKRAAAAVQPKATTFRLDPPLQEGLMRLQVILKQPLNRLVNEAVRGFIQKRTAEVESDLQQILTRVKVYRRSDPKFKKAIAQFVDAEARFGSDDPAEGRAEASAGPAQAMVHKFLCG
jgi:predicted transcriptional regulator